MRVNRQGGSVLNFVVVGVALALLLFVGAYAVKTYVANYNADSGDEVAVTDADESETSEETSEPATDKEDTETTSDSDDSNTSSTGQDDATTDSSSANEQDGHVHADDEGQDNATAVSDELPQTGPGLIALQAFGISALSGAAVLFGVSRRS